MTEQIELRYIAESQPSLCIPRVFNNITEARIRQVFLELDLGKLSRIDIKERKNEKGESFKRVYIHFEKWAWNENAQAARRKLVSGKEIKIVYDNPWFWKVSASKWTEPPAKPIVLKREKAHIDFGEDKVDEFGRDINKKQDIKRPDNKKQDIKRPDIHQKQDIRDNRRHNDARDNRMYKDDRRIQIAPTLTLKEPVSVPVPVPVPISETNENPADIIPANNDTSVAIDYGNIAIPIIQKKRKPALKKNLDKVVIEDNERYADMSEEDKNDCKLLYSDLA